MCKRNCSLNRDQGFTLIELMITIAIVAILLGIAIPSYQDHLRKAKRTDARITLHNLVVAQETHFFRTNTYATKFSELRAVADSVMTIPSEHGFYAITMAGDVFSWSITATAVAQQAEDLQCASFSISHLGIITAFDANGVLRAGCW